MTNTLRASGARLALSYVTRCGMSFASMPDTGQSGLPQMDCRIWQSGFLEHDTVGMQLHINLHMIFIRKR